MKNEIAVPSIPYIVFELVRINVDQYISDQSYKAEQINTIYLAVLPSQISYTLQSRDAIRQTDKKVFVNKFGLAPEKVTISGNFGREPRLVAGTYLDGWSRLKQFEKEVVRRSKETEITDNGAKYLYSLNYYDFTLHRFGNVNIQQFRVSGNANQNSLMPYYSCDFSIIGPLIDVESTDYLLQGLLGLFGENAILDDILTIPEYVMTVAQPIILGLESLDRAASLIQESYQLVIEAGEFLEGIGTNVQSVYKNVASLF